MNRVGNQAEIENLNGCWSNTFFLKLGKSELETCPSSFHALWRIFQLELSVIKICAREKTQLSRCKPLLSLSPDFRFSKPERLKKAAVIGRCYCMWHCLPQTLDTNISCPEAGFSCASRGAIWDIQNTWDRFAGLMDMTQYLQEIQVLWEQQWEATSKGMDTWNKQHLWGIQRLFLCLLLLIHIPWCLSGEEKLMVSHYLCQWITQRLVNCTTGMCN